MADLDPRFTFENFVVGPANRLASAAAKRAAESPGESYNPLFLYSASGLGKTHILGAIAHHVERVYPDKAISYQTLEGFLADLTEALGEGDREGGKDRYEKLEILLMDDVQFLAGQSEAQEMLLRLLDKLTGAGKQVILASDRPPADIDHLDSRLRSRFEGGLLVDIGPPEYETRVAIIRKQAEARGQVLTPEVAEVIGRIQYKNVRELGGALNRILAVQELEDRAVTPEEAASLLGVAPKETQEAAKPAAGDFLDELSDTVAAQVERQEAVWRKELREAAEEAEAEGFKATRLRRLMEQDNPPGDVAVSLDEFRSTTRRLAQIKDLLDAVGNPWPEAAHGVLRDPERLDEAEALLASAKERARPFPAIGPGPGLEGMSASVAQLVVRAADQLVKTDRQEYNPLYVWSDDGVSAKKLLEAAGRSYQALHEEARVALVSVSEFAEDFIDALSRGVAGAWRERWWSAELLLVHGAEDLSNTERAQDEFFHLFEALQRRKARIMFAADRPPADLKGIDDRLRSRFEGGLVLEVIGKGQEEGPVQVGSMVSPDKVEPPLSPPEEMEADTALSAAGTAEPPPPAAESPPEARNREVPKTEPEKEEKDISALDREWIMGFSSGSPVLLGREVQDPDLAQDEVTGAGEEGEMEAWFPSPERVVWEWPRIEERVVEDPD